MQRGAKLEAARQQLGGASEGEQLDVDAWATAAGEHSVEALQSALVAAERAKAALVIAHIGFLHKLAYRFKNRVRTVPHFRGFCESLYVWQAVSG